MYVESTIFHGHEVNMQQSLIKCPLVSHTAAEALSQGWILYVSCSSLPCKNCDLSDECWKREGHVDWSADYGYITPTVYAVVSLFNEAKAIGKRAHSELRVRNRTG